MLSRTLLILNRQGDTLTGVMVAMVIATVVLLAQVKTTTSLTEASLRTQHQLSATFITNEIQSILRDPRSCAASIPAGFNLAALPIQIPTITKFFDPPIAPIVMYSGPGQILDMGGLTFKPLDASGGGFHIASYTPYNPALPERGAARVTLSFVSNISAATRINKEFNLDVKLQQGTQLVAECASTLERGLYDCQSFDPQPGAPLVGPGVTITSACPVGRALAGYNLAVNNNGLLAFPTEDRTANTVSVLLSAVTVDISAGGLSALCCRVQN